MSDGCTADFQHDSITSEAEVNVQDNKLQRLYVMFIFMWQTLFRVSDAGIEILLLFISTFFSLLAQVFTSDKLVAFARKLPKTIYRAKKLIGANVDNFLRYTVCPKCYHLYPVESCKVQLADGSTVSKLCDHVEFPEHPHITQRQPCTTVLMKKV